jgi:hypothetical protein
MKCVLILGGLWMVTFVRVMSRQRQEYFMNTGTRLKFGKSYYEWLAHCGPTAYSWAWRSGS